MKRIISLILSVIMVISLSTVAFAEDELSELFNSFSPIDKTIFSFIVDIVIEKKQAGENVDLQNSLFAADLSELSLDELKQMKALLQDETDVSALPTSIPTQAARHDSYASSDQENPKRYISFRDTPWGASYEEAVANLPKGIRMTNLDEDWAASVGNAMYEADKNVYRGYVCANTSARSSSLDGVKVAGYDVSNIHLCFAFVPNEKGLLEKDAEHTALYFAYYKLAPKNVDAAYEDLLAKLSSVYGEVDNTNYAGYTVLSTYNTWFGKDGTLVTLEKKDYGDYAYIYIKYAFLGGNDLLQAAYDALVLEESLSSASNVDGL